MTKSPNRNPYHARHPYEAPVPFILYLSYAKEGRRRRRRKEKKGPANMYASWVSRVKLQWICIIVTLDPTI